jgi:hypothetical protein
MKLAIIGSGPLAIFCAQYFDQMGAEVVLFQKNALGGNVRFLLDHFPEMEIMFENKIKTIGDFWEIDLVSAITSIEENKLTQAGEVLRVHKRFLHSSETIPGKSRIHDLFRVIYSVNPKDAILKQLEENPEMFKQLGEQVIKSLHSPVESFEDFDIVIEARGLGRPALPMGPSHALALNEKNIKETNLLLYEKDIFTELKLEGKNQLVLIGDSNSAILALLKCKDWLFSKTNQSLVWITHKTVRQIGEGAWLNNQLCRLLDESDAKFENDKIIFEKEMHEWRDLEDYVKAKIAKPLEPQPKIIIFQGYNVTSVDRLLDRDGVFATIESPDFRSSSLIPNDLKTLPAETIMIACGVEDDLDFAKGINLNEDGYYRLNATSVNEAFTMIKKIEQQVLTFFSRAK